MAKALTITFVVPDEDEERAKEYIDSLEVEQGDSEAATGQPSWPILRQPTRPANAEEAKLLKE